MSVSKATLNPVRMRIIQHLMVHKTTTAKALTEIINDVPRTTLYRHIKTLEDAKIIQVVEENKIRGTVEKVYSLMTEQPEGEEQSPNQVTAQFMLEILGRFERYFQKGEGNPQEDMLFMRSASFNLTDAEYVQMIGELGEVMKKYLDFEKTSERKVRQLSTISSPYENS